MAAVLADILRAQLQNLLFSLSPVTWRDVTSLEARKNYFRNSFGAFQQRKWHPKVCLQCRIWTRVFAVYILQCFGWLGYSGGERPLQAAPAAWRIWLAGTIQNPSYREQTSTGGAFAKICPPMPTEAESFCCINVSAGSFLLDAVADDYLGRGVRGANEPLQWGSCSAGSRHGREKQWGEISGVEPAYFISDSVTQ